MATQFQGAVRELFSGILHKCGGKHKSWTKRFFILKDDYCLYYYKDTTKGHLGVISLRDTKFKVRRGEPSDVSWPKGTDLSRTFVVVTVQRTYCMFAGTKDEAEMWIRALHGARDKLVESLDGGRPQGQRSLSTSNVTTSNTGSNGHRTLSETDRPLSDAALSAPRSPNGPERQLTYEEMGPAPSDSIGPDSIYDVAKPVEEVIVSQYMEVDATPTNQDRPSETPEALYDTATAVTEETPSALYEEVAPDSSIQSQPLPPLPERNDTITMGTGQALYEDVGGAGGQPLYEDVGTEQGSKVGSGRETVREIEESAEFTPPPRDRGSGDGPPPLLPMDDLPPLPPRDNLPPLPPKEPSPPLPPKDSDPPKQRESPPLPPKDSPERPRLPPLPPKDDPSDRHHDNCTTDVKNDINNLLHNGSPPTPHPVNESPPTPHRVNGSPPTPHRVNESPPTPHRVDGSPPTPHKVNESSPTPHRVNGSLPTPHRVNGYDIGDTQHTPPSPHTPRTQRPPSSHSTPPSYRSTPPQGSPASQPTHRTPPSPRDNLTPPTPRKRTITPPASPQALHTPHTPPSPRKPSPTPRRRPINIISEPTVEPQSSKVTSPQEDTKEDTKQMTSPMSPDRGRDLFMSRQERVRLLSNSEGKRRADTIQLMTSDPTMSSSDKATFAQTLREVEQEKLAASEERFRWERERMKFEEERRQFEQETRRLQVQLEAAQKQLQNKT